MSPVIDKPIGSKKRFDKVRSHFHLLFHMDGKFMMKEFPCMEELAKFVKQLSLAWSEYGIIHGELVKELPQRDADDDLSDSDFEDQPESGIQDLDPETARELLDRHEDL